MKPSRSFSEPSSQKEFLIPETKHAGMIRYEILIKALLFLGGIAYTLTSIEIFLYQKGSNGWWRSASAGALVLMSVVALSVVVFWIFEDWKADD